MRGILVGIVLNAFVAGSSFAAPFDDGASAYASGDYQTAVEFWLPLAEAGNPTAQFNMGVMYDQGQGVKQDLAAAEKWYRLAAEQGDTVAQTNLGVIFSQGRGVARDYAEAAKWYERAAASEHGPAQFSLGTLYANGRGVEQNLSKATFLYERAELNSCTSGASVTSTRARLVAPQA
jgi:TPR repeat protein